MLQMNMDVAGHLNQMEKGGGGSSMPRYKPLPFDAGTIHFNDVIIPLFDPSLWGLFNPSAEDAAKYGYASDGSNGPVGINPMGAYYFPVPVHSVQKFQYPDGNTGFASIICPIELNKQVQNFSGQNLFQLPIRCAHCEAAEKLWSEHNARWAEMGVDKRGLDKNAYNSYIKADPVLKRTRDAARVLKTQDKYVMNVFDHAKFTGQRPLDEGQQNVELELWFSPMSVFKDLGNLYTMNTQSIASGSVIKQFYDTSDPAAIPIVTITKDTRECKGNNLMLTKYGALSNKTHAYDQAWLDYFNTVTNHKDPTPYLHMVTYEEGQRYVEAETSSGYNKPMSTPTAGAAAPPTMPSPQAGPPAAAGGLPPQPAMPAAQAAPPAMAPPAGGLPPQAPVAPAGPPQAPVAPAAPAAPAGPPQAPVAAPAGPPQAPVAPAAQAAPPTQAAPPVPPTPAAPPAAAGPSPLAPGVAANAPLPDRTPPGVPAPGRRNWD